jgi:hypothetical protein
MTSRVGEESVISRQEQLLTHSYEQVHDACNAYNHHDVAGPKRKRLLIDVRPDAERRSCIENSSIAMSIQVQVQWRVAVKRPSLIQH